MCNVLKINRSGYYKWLNKKDSNKIKQDKEFTKMIKAISIEGRNVYGARRIKKRLEQDNVIISRKRISRLMSQAGLICKTKRKFKATTNSQHNLSIAPNLLNQNFKVTLPILCFVGDITYISTEEGWLYLATVIDLYSRKIVGWSMSDRMKAELVNNALLMAVWTRKPKAGLIWLAVRGSQYCADSHLKIIERHGIIRSMSRKGDCYDNAVA